MNFTKKVPFTFFHVITVVVFEIETELERKSDIIRENSVLIQLILRVGDQSKRNTLDQPLEFIQPDIEKKKYITEVFRPLFYQTLLIVLKMNIINYFAERQ